MNFDDLDYQVECRNVLTNNFDLQKGIIIRDVIVLLEGGKKISSKEMGEKGRDSLPPFPTYMTSLESSFSKWYSLGFVLQNLSRKKHCTTLKKFLFLNYPVSKWKHLLCLFLIQLLNENITRLMIKLYKNLLFTLISGIRKDKTMAVK